MSALERTTVHAPHAQELVRELLEIVGEDEHTARRIELAASSAGVEITVEAITGEEAAPGESRPGEVRHYLVTPAPVEVVDLVGALRASVEAAKDRRLAAAARARGEES